MPTPQATERGYHNLWAKAAIRKERLGSADNLAKRALDNRKIYDDVTAKTGVPWFVLAAIHTRESNMSFKGVLHNGQPIIGTGRKTTIVPVGRGPFGSWVEAAIDAIAFKKLDQVQRWSVERCLFECERWNGWGYLGKGNSPYIWSWTTLYQSGKYVKDHVYDPYAVDVQPGCAAIFKALAKIDPSVAHALADSEPTAPPAVIKDAAKEATSTERKIAAGAGAGTVATAGTKATTDAPKDAPVTSFAHAYLLPLGIAIFIAILIVAVVRIRQKSDQIKKLW